MFYKQSKQIKHRKKPMFINQEVMERFKSKTNQNIYQIKEFMKRIKKT